jgi:ribosomal protein L11 methylase PrmA
MSDESPALVREPGPITYHPSLITHFQFCDSIRGMPFQQQLLCAALVLLPAFAQGADFDRSGGPYVPTPPAVVEAMLKLANVGPADYVIDLGSGDGRIVLMAATKFNARGMGVDIDPELVERANASARKLGVADRAKFEVRDALKADVGQATVMTLYLLPGMMASLQQKLLAELKPGTRIVSHDFTFDKWKPDRTVTVETEEKYEMTGFWTSDVHLWIVPSPAQSAR